MSNARALRLAEILATRLCHDLSGPMSGLLAALGEVAEDPGALDLAQEAGAVLRLRLLLLRAAWGAPAALPADSLRDLMAGLPNAHRLMLTLGGQVAAANLPPVPARLIVNAVLLAAESLPLGGGIALEGDPAAQVTLRIDGRRAAWPDGLAAMLADDAAAWAALREDRPALLLPAVLALLAQQAGVAVQLPLGSAGGAATLLLDFGAPGRPAGHGQS